MGLHKPTFKQRFKRWWNTRIKGMVTLTTISRDPETGGYRFDTVLTTREELPINAVHNTGDPYGFSIDAIGVKHGFRESENGFSAIDLNLWLESNDINDCLALKWDGFEKAISTKTIIYITAALIIGLIVFYVAKGGF